MSAFDSTEELIGKFYFGSGVLVKPTHWAVSLWTTVPNDDGTSGVELADNLNGHVRPLIPNSATYWNFISGGIIKNKLQISLGVPTGEWSANPITHFSLLENSVTGVARFYGVFSTPITVSGAGAEKVILPEQLIITLD